MKLAMTLSLKYSLTFPGTFGKQKSSSRELQGPNEVFNLKKKTWKNIGSGGKHIWSTCLLYVGGATTMRYGEW